MFQVKALEIASKYGFPAVVIVLLIGLYVYTLREHKKERTEWKDAFKGASKDMSTAVNNNTALLNEMKGLFQGALQSLLTKEKT